MGQGLERARRLAARGEDDAAKQAYIDVLRADPTDFHALNELGTLAYASGHRSAARTAYVQAVLHHPRNPIGHVNLGNLLADDGDLCGARLRHQSALDIDPDFAEAHRGLAQVLSDLDDDAADLHWGKGFAGRALVTKPCRSTRPGVPLLLLVAARGGNIPTRHWIDDRRFAVTALYTEFYDGAQKLPQHALIVNAIGDADLCGVALARAEAVIAHSTAPVINSPARVRATDRAGNARRLANLPGVIAPRIATLPRATLLADDGAATDALTAAGLKFPLLLRAPGFHTGRHFHYVGNWGALARAACTLPGDELLAIEYLDARGPDGMARKYRAMFIDGVPYPLHLAIAADWKVHYFTSAMAENDAHRNEERRFLEDMPAVLGERAMAALVTIGITLGLDYAGIDFALVPDGSVLLFEANATMVVNPPEVDPIWDYRRGPIEDVLQATRHMLLRRANDCRAS